MRYENWDTLLFPDESIVPMQEFSTQCSVTRGRQSAFTSEIPHTHLAMLPVVTAYVRSLPDKTPFRVSIHCWDIPQPSRWVEGLMQPKDALAFQFQVFIDGIVVATCVFGPRTSWPQTIDLSSAIDKNGEQEPLLFPKFHPEVLKVPSNVDDLFGRVVVVVSEGFARPYRSPPIERVRDTVAFSFLHAPLDVLERTNIAWPSPSMWMIALPPQDYNSGGALSKDLGNTHTHSPRRQKSRVAFSAQPFHHNSWPRPAALVERPSVQDGSMFGRQEPYPSVDPYFVDHRGARSSADDISMPDYCSNSSGTRSRASSNMSNISYEHSKQPSVAGLLNEDQYDRVFRNLEVPAEAQPFTCNRNDSFPPRMRVSSAEACPASSAKSPGRRPPLSLVAHDGHNDLPITSVLFEPDAQDASTDGFYVSPIRDDAPISIDLQKTPRKTNGGSTNLTPTMTHDAANGNVSTEMSFGYKGSTALISSDKNPIGADPNGLAAGLMGILGEAGV